MIIENFFLFALCVFQGFLVLKLVNRLVAFSTILKYPEKANEINEFIERENARTPESPNRILKRTDEDEFDIENKRYTG